MDKTSKNLIQSLNALLANSFILQLKTQNYHWNYTGPNFYAIHLLLEKQYEELQEVVDNIAEHIRALGYKVDASLVKFKEISTLDEADFTLTADAMIQDLISSHTKLITLIEKIIKQASEENAFASEDLAIERLHSHQKNAWLLSSNL